MTFLVIIFIFALGAVVGSFFNVVLLRKNTGESIIWAGSHCFSCGRALEPLDMVPIFSFLCLRGKCGKCGSKISWQYPLVEFLTGTIALLTFVKIANLSPYAISLTPYGLELRAYGIWLYYFSAFGALFLVAAYDVKQKIIDNHFFYIFSVFAVLEALWRWISVKNFDAVAGDLASSFFIALFFYCFWYFSDGTWMGRGDADLAFATSLFLGFPDNVAALFLAFWIGGLLGAFLLLFRGKKFGLKTEIPFGPFLALGCLIAWYFDVLRILW